MVTTSGLGAQSREWVHSPGKRNGKRFLIPIITYYVICLCIKKPGENQSRGLFESRQMLWLVVPQEGTGLYKGEREAKLEEPGFGTNYPIQVLLFESVIVFIIMTKVLFSPLFFFNKSFLLQPC